MSDYLRKRMENILSGRPLPEKKKYKIKQVSDKRAAKEAEQKESKSEAGKERSLGEWFDEIERKHWANGFCACMETGELIPQKYARASIAHLLPKAKFHSVATHPLNYLILSAHNGSHQKTDRVDNFVQMKIWPEAKRRMLIMIPLLPHDELAKISEQLDEALNNY